MEYNEAVKQCGMAECNPQFSETENELLWCELGKMGII